MNNYRNLSSWREQNIVCKAGINDIDFLDTKPNQFIIQNTSAYPVYVSISKTPSKDSYELYVEKNTTATWGRPIPTSKLYIYNPTNIEIPIKVYSVYDVFDMNILRGSKVYFDEMKVRTDGIVKGFGAGISLPSGLNHLGEVSVEDFNEFQENLLNINNVEGKYNLKTIVDSLYNLGTKLDNLEVGLKADNEPTKTLEESKFNGVQESDSDTQEIYDNGNVIYNHIEILNNKSNADIKVDLYYNDNDFVSLYIGSKDYVSNINLTIVKMVFTSLDTNENVSVSVVGSVLKEQPTNNPYNDTYSVSENGLVLESETAIPLYVYMEFINNLSDYDVEVKLYYSDTDYIHVVVPAGCYISEITMDIFKIEVTAVADSYDNVKVSLFGK